MSPHVALECRSRPMPTNVGPSAFRNESVRRGLQVFQKPVFVASVR